jgi:hypothetical protein
MNALILRNRRHIMIKKNTKVDNEEGSIYIPEYYDRRRNVY